MTPGLDPHKDYKQVFPYSLIFPFLVSEEILQSYQELRGDRIAIGPSHLEKFIDVDGEIPNCIREYLQLDDNYQTIKDVFTPHALDAILKDIKTLHSPLNPSKMHKDHRKFIIDQMKEYLSLGLRNFPNGPAIGLEEYPDGLSVEDWAYSVAMRFIKSCAEHIDKTLTEKYFTGNGSDTIVLLDALGQDGIIIGASVFRLIDLLIIKLPSNNIPNRHVVQNAGGPVPLMSFMPYLSRDDQSVRKHCRDLSLEISHEYKRNEGDNRPIFAEFLLSLINSNGNIPVLALGLLHSILEGNAIKPILIKTIQKFENHTQLGCPVKKGLGGINLILETILNKATKLNVE